MAGLSKELIATDDPFWWKIRQWLDVRSIPEPNSGCFLWLSGLTKAGYGIVNTGRSYETAHRLSYAVHRGAIPAGLHVLHTCDLRCCINPGHLYLGFERHNGDDRANRNRCRPLRGADNKRVKLTRDQVLAILVDPRSHRVIAAEYGVSKGPIGRIKQGRGWTHLTQISRQPPSLRSVSGNFKLNHQQVIQIRTDDRPIPEIAADYGLCEASVSNVRQRRSWREV